MSMNEWLSVELRNRDRLPQWLKDAVQAARFGVGDDRLPLLVLHENGTYHADDLVVMRLTDFEAWFGGFGADADTQDNVHYLG